MDGEQLNQIVNVENKFLELSKAGNPNVFDTGLFLDAVLDVTAALKEHKGKDIDAQNLDKKLFSDYLGVIDNLYNSLKDFEHLYLHCLKQAE